eukprot:CAMPEP_0206190816 /NCGR_PEP_ID=MMETSP0166-20121206/4968_1 /ASSEMBLY_ACC=CAM_ASM_000260 /TAXON_ID=95228 /ORGANISM="Vannella robusta, Strain DIVA3 518/3/11/1/6" /LENGTH=315 /DNA_ID=CAMNT_0053606953 /DNA_START=258 /DNA_END=1202 /DNA_ORIENTATION=-
MLHYYGFLLNPFDNSPTDTIWISVAGQNLPGCALMWHWIPTTKRMEAHRLSLREPAELLFSISPTELTLSSKGMISKPIISATEAGRRVLVKNSGDSFSSDPLILEVEKQNDDGPVPRHKCIKIGGNKGMKIYPVRIRPECERVVPIEGLWVAEYSIHGTELLHFTIQTQAQLENNRYNNIIDDSPESATYESMPTLYEPGANIETNIWPLSEGTRLVGHKLTGDYNIPADTDSFVIFLDKILPTESNSSYPASFRNAFPVGRVTDVDRDIDSLQVAAKYGGYGRIANHNMLNAAWIPLQFCIFQDDMDTAMLYW